MSFCKNRNRNFLNNIEIFCGTFFIVKVSNFMSRIIYWRENTKLAA